MGSYDFNGRDEDPFPSSNYDTHGTKAAGCAAASSNSACGGTRLMPVIIFYIYYRGVIGRKIRYIYIYMSLNMGDSFLNYSLY